MSEIRDVVRGLSWQEVVLAIAALAAVVALFFAPAASCSVRISDGDTTTTTTATTTGTDR